MVTKLVRTLSRAPATVGRRIAVWGPTGSGKTTMSRKLAIRLGLPAVELDALFHGPNWQPSPDDEFRVMVQEVLDDCSMGWVCDGNFRVAREVVLPRADTVLWLRPPFRVAYWRLLRRTISRLSSREELWNGNRESWGLTFLSRDSILLWGISHWRKHHRNVTEALRVIPHQAQVLELWSDADVQTVLAYAGSPSGATSA